MQQVVTRSALIDHCKATSSQVTAAETTACTDLYVILQAYLVTSGHATACITDVSGPARRTLVAPLTGQGHEAHWPQPMLL